MPPSSFLRTSHLCPFARPSTQSVSSRCTVASPAASQVIPAGQPNGTHSRMADRDAMALAVTCSVGASQRCGLGDGASAIESYGHAVGC